MEQEILIPNKSTFDRKKAAFKAGGVSKMHVLSDFDRTLTYAFVDGKKAPSIIGGLRSGKYLTPDYVVRSTALYEKYRPIEIDPLISLEEKSEKMHEWWKTHFELLVECGLDKGTMEQMVNENLSRFRQGADIFLAKLDSNKIPVVIMSAGPGDAIEMIFQKNSLLFPNINIIANVFEFDQNGKVAKIKEPIIHSINKSEITIKSFPEIFENIKDRRNVLLLGDNVSDIGMAEGFPHDCLLKIGFLVPDAQAKENMEEFKRNFDVILTGDGDMSYVNQLINEII
jgi:5'-nucleotidase